MFPQPMSRPEFNPEDSPTDLARLLEQHILAGFPPDLALDLVLNELVVRAAEATRATAAAVALARGNEAEMVCRAATGHLAPDLGIAINTRDGLSGACLQTRQPQLSVDTEFDPRLDPAVSRHLGIRSILIVPVFEANNTGRFAGVLEIFSTSPAAFSHNDQIVLEGFAEECARIRQSASELGQRQLRKRGQHNPVSTHSPEVIPADLDPGDFITNATHPAKRPTYEAWTLVLGAFAIAAIIAVSFLIGNRIGWLRPATDHVGSNASAQGNLSFAQPLEPGAISHHSTIKSVAKTFVAASSKSISAPATDELVVYEKGKIIFRMSPAPARLVSKKDTTPDVDLAKAREGADSIVEASSTKKISASFSVWLSPEQAETRLLSRTEPEYPPEALASNRSGKVVLEIQVGEDGSVSNIRTLSGDPLLAIAATDAVKSWRYQPYRQKNDHPSQFQTDISLTFNLPN
jgi:TonB family protein